jgi:SAM-dependent methyltransferase
LSAPPCAACGSRASRRAFEASDWYLGRVTGLFAYHRCVECRTVFLHPQPDDATLAAAYGESYGPYRPGQSAIGRLGERLAQREADRLAALTDRSALLLDVGCGTGAFLHRLRRAGWQGPIRALEPDPAAAAAARETLGVPVTVATLEDADFEPASAGVVVMRHVIEHLRDPQAALQRAAATLAPGGVLYVATPDARALAARVFGRFWHGYDPPRHLFAFTSDGVRRMLARAGFRLLAEDWQFSPQMWTGSLRHALGRGRGHRWVGLAGHDLNPLAAAPAAVGATLEVALRRSTMYAATAELER